MISLTDRGRKSDARKRNARRAAKKRSQLKKNETYGPPELCTWCVGPGDFRFQTNSPDIARKLSKRSNACLVAWGINFFLRIYAERMCGRQAIKLVNRYLASPNSAFSELEDPPARRKCGRGS